MQIRLPWVLSRKRLVAAAVVDAILFSGLYYALFHWRFDRLPGISFRLAVLLAMWMLCSYVVGRYANADARCQFNGGLGLVRQIFSTALVFAVSLGFTIVHLWLFNQNLVDATLRSFLLPFLGVLAILSPLAQLIVIRVAACKETSRNILWSFVGSLDGFERLKQSLQWTRIPVTLDYISLAKLTEISPQFVVVEDFNSQAPDTLNCLLQLQQNGSIVFSRFNWCEDVLQRFPSELLTDADLLRGEFSIQSGTFESRLKRIADVFVAVSLLLITSPLLMIAALLIKLGDQGPIFYSQIRTGLDGQPYRIWKLRSMRVDAEKKGIQWSSRSDSRITKVGAVLRRTRLDELPQLFCVIMGTMSLIGPRPERPEFDLQLSQKIPYYNLRHRIRPGLSGWAQVNYAYGASIQDASNKLSYDLYYLRNFSLLLDLLILFKTIRLVFNAQGSLPASPPSLES